MALKVVKMDSTRKFDSKNIYLSSDSRFWIFRWFLGWRLQNYILALSHILITNHKWVKKATPGALLDTKIECYGEKRVWHTICCWKIDKFQLFDLLFRSEASLGGTYTTQKGWFDPKVAGKLKNPFLIVLALWKSSSTVTFRSRGNFTAFSPSYFDFLISVFALTS